mmetsp:Transcript_116043/g.308666  ORF Transcript_116043/g.308666 Transcript_116043/m.308666 type:complete len:532 (-) Transcript_116043:56-1651(-)
MGPPPPSSRTLLLASVAVSLASATIFRRAEPPDLKPVQSSAEDRLLLFWAVGSSPEAMRLVSRNIAHARKFEAGQPGVLRPLVIDHYLAHYDLNRSGWEATMGAEWYRENVKYSARLTGVKFWLATDLLLGNHKTRNALFYNPMDPHDVAMTYKSIRRAKSAKTTTKVAAFLEGILQKSTQGLDRVSEDLVHGGIGALSKQEWARLPKRDRLPALDLATYEYAWLLDEDALFTDGLDLRRMVDHARESNANILTPSILFEGETGDPRHARLEDTTLWLNATNETNRTKPPPQAWGAVPMSPSARIFDEHSAEGYCHWLVLVNSSSGTVEECIVRGAMAKRERNQRFQESQEYRHEQQLLRRRKIEEQKRREKYRPLYPGDLAIPAMYEEETLSDLGLGCQRNDTPCDLQAPVPSCSYRYTNFVEVSFPLMKPKAFYKVLGDCPFCLQRRGSIWGLDRVWCSMSADISGAANRSCAILDQSPVVHMNYKTLPKWNHDYHLALANYNWGNLYEVMDRGRKFWAQDAMALSCAK